MQTLEGVSRQSKEDAVARALTSANIKKAGDEERVDVNILSVWEEEDGFHAKVAVRHTPVRKPKADGGDQGGLNDAVAYEAEEALALFVPDAAHQYRAEDEDTETMKEEPRFAELHEKVERDFEKAEHLQSAPKPAARPGAAQPEPHVEGTAKEEE